MNTTKILSLLICLSSLFGCRKNDDNDNRKTYLTVYRHGSGHIAYTYDDDGRLTGETDINARGETDVHRTYRQFNAAGMPERIDFSFPGSPSHKPYLLIEYDGNARPVKITNYATDGTAGPYDTFTYLTGRIEYRTYNFSGAEQRSGIYTLDNAGNLLSVVYSAPDAISNWRLVFTGYDNKKAPVHPYKYLAIALNEAPNFFSVNNYTGYEAYYGTTLDARYSCTHTYNQQGYATGRVTTDLISNVALEEFFEYVER
ncbi:hypothetical protein [Niabella aquatica]